LQRYVLLDKKDRNAQGDWMLRFFVFMVFRGQMAETTF
jgi:hypothetical protein